MHKYVLYLLVAVSIYFIAFKQADRMNNVTISKQKEQIVTLNEQLQKTVKDYQSQLAQQNNVTTVKTVYLPSGQRIVTHVVDKSIILEQKRDVSEEVKEVVQNKSELRESDLKVSKSSPNYLLGINQDYKHITDTNVNLIAGMRLFASPIFVTVETPLHLNQVSIGFILTF